MLSLSFRAYVRVAAGLALASLASAQINISGALSDSTTGPLGANVYHVTGPINVPTGQTLTVAAGAVIKFNNGGYFYVYGTLDVNGASGSEVIFTDIRDDTAGGDSNGDGGATSPGAGWWYGLFLEADSDASTLDQFEVRYGGYGGYPVVRLSSSSASLTNGKLRNGSAHGLDGNGTASYPTVTNCAFENNVGAAITGMRFDALPGFTGNTAAGNGRNALEVAINTLAASTTIGPNNGINGVIYSAGYNSVPAGATLTIGAGTTIKWANGGYMYVYGTLDVNGSSGNKVIFTDYRDDSAGGDTNGDAAGSTPGAGWWYGLLFEAGSSASTADYLELRYGGYGGYPGLNLVTTSPAFTNCTVVNGAAEGMDLHTTASYPSVTGCTFQSNAAQAIRGVRFDALPGFSNNTATGNGFNQVLVEQATLALDVTVGPSDGINGTVVVSVPLNLPAGRTLNLQAGLTIKYLNGGYSYIDGTLNAVGTSISNVVFTDYRDDSAGGDTNGDGASTSPTPGWWYGLIFRTGSDASALDYFDLRYAGYGGYAGLELQSDVNPTITRGTIRYGSAAGIDLNATQAKPKVNRCLIQGNAGSAITGAAIDALPFITRNTAFGNGLNQILVSDCQPAADLYIDGTAGVNDVIVLGAPLIVPASVTLRIGPGATFKLQSGGYVGVYGALEVEGSAADPVVFTDYRDDAIGGDTNGDGAGSAAAPGWWYGVIFYAGGFDVEHALVRYAGYGGYPGFNLGAAGASLRHCRTDLSGGGGFVFYAGATRAEHLAVWSTAGTGVALFAGAFDLRHVTVHGSTIGIAKTGSWSGSVVDSCVWSSGTSYSGLSAAEVRYSDGFVGGVGNINVDPMFVDAPNGDLHLQAGSPCVGAGDPFSELDPDCSSSDMGAYPQLGATAPFIYCAGKTNSAGCVPYMAWSGFASASSAEPFFIRAYSVVNNKNGLFYYGVNGPLAVPFQGGTKCVAPPTLRLPILGSGGSASGNDCSGSYEFDFNAHIQGGADPALMAGVNVNAQCWYRDPQVPSATGLSNGLQFRICN